MSSLLTVKNLTVGIEETTTLREVDFTIEEGETVVIIGSNGAGKSLLVRTLMGLIPAKGGEIIWKPGVKIGYVPQKFNVEKQVPITIKEFLALKGPITSAKISETLKKVGLPEESRKKTVSTLSGGQFQRMIVAWSILDNPNVLVFDEPTESVDVGGQASIYTLIDTLKKEQGITVFLVTHDLDTVYSYGDRVLCLSQGSLVCSGSPKNSLTTEALNKIYGHDTHSHAH